MKACLKTRCGCVRALEISYPPQPILEIALRGPRINRRLDDILTGPTLFLTRVFKLIKICNRETAHYEEEEIIE